MAAWRSFILANARLTEVLERELMDEHDLPLTWYDVLVQLHEAGGSLRMHDLANAVLLSKSGVTRLVDRMVSAGLVGRESCPSDRRGTLAVLTAAGKDRLRRAAPTHLRGVEQHFASLLRDGEVDVVRDVFARVVGHVAHRPDPAAETPRGS